MTLKEFLKAVNGKESDIIVYAFEKETLEAVRQNGNALRYVGEQTEAVCLEAVRQNGNALQYVNKKIFE